MSKSHCFIKYFDESGDPVGESNTVHKGCIPGVARTLQQEGVKSIEVHRTDGTSEEYTFMPDL